MIPYLQGELDGLCGLYAVINAVRYALAPHRRFTRLECTVLFAEGVTTLAAKGELEGAIWGGMDYGTCFRLAKRLCNAANEMTTFAIYANRPFSRRRRVDVPEVIEQLRKITASGAVAIISTTEHWTVVTSCTARRLNLFDSAKSYWYAIAGIRSAEEWEGARHILVPRSVIVIEAER